MSDHPVNVFSVDVEDWYQGLEIDMDDWSGYEKRLDIGMKVVVDLLEETQTRATFFVLGDLAEKDPGMVCDLAARGHEIASHGHSHRFVYRQRPEEFREELKRSKGALEDAGGQAVVGYRAPFFSITNESLWALDILAEEGFLYDSSVMPALNYRYGIAGAGRSPGWITTPSGARIYEIPLSTVRVPHHASPVGMNVPMCGGGYFRLYPYTMTRALADSLSRGGEPFIFYVHPWEYDPDHPRVKMPRWMPQMTHYHNLSSMTPKTARLLRDFRFGTNLDAFGDAMKAGV